MTTYAIEAEGLTKRFGSTTALAGVDLAVPSGAVVGMLGPNGAGKTTAVRILATRLRPDAGRALITVIDHGSVVATGRPDELKRRTGGQTLQGVAGVGGRLGVPQVGHQGVDGDEPAGVQGQPDQQRAQAGAADLHGTAVVGVQPKRTEQHNPHPTTLSDASRPPARNADGRLVICCLLAFDGVLDIGHDVRRRGQVDRRNVRHLARLRFAPEGELRRLAGTLAVPALDVGDDDLAGL
jgi:energy-coupling factor transporter ATP-binding protein EcfA2